MFKWILSWHKIPKEIKDWLWDALDDVWDFIVIEEEYDMNADDILQVRKVSVMKHAWKLSRNSNAQWKSKYYKPHVDPNERLANVPPGLYNEDWEELTKFWDNEDSI